jgi:putative redox protein
MANQKKPKIVHVHLPKDEAFKSTLTAGDHELIADEPESVKGGTDQGPDPYDYLLMSLGSCTVMTVKMYARRKEWALDDVFLELKHNQRHDKDCENCEEAESKIDVIQKELIIKGELSDEQLNKLLDISKKCPVHRTLLGEMEIESSVSRK